MNKDIWKPESFLIAHATMPFPVAGYTYRGLGLSVIKGPSPKGRRPPVWSLSHLGSGHRICTIAGSVAVVFPVATEIAEAGDWTFDGIDGWKNQFPDVKEKLLEVEGRNPCLSFKQGVASREAALKVLMERGAYA